MILSKAVVLIARISKLLMITQLKILCALRNMVEENNTLAEMSHLETEEAQTCSNNQSKKTEGDPRTGVLPRTILTDKILEVNSEKDLPQEVEIDTKKATTRNTAATETQVHTTTYILFNTF